MVLARLKKINALLIGCATFCIERSYGFSVLNAERLRFWFVQKPAGQKTEHFSSITGKQVST